MTLSRGSTVSFHALALLAALPVGQVLSVEELATAVGASPTYMTKLLGRLRRAGLVGAQRGRTGGYALARSPEDVSLWDVVGALEDVSRPSPDLLPICASCRLAATCPVRGVLRDADVQVQKRLESLTVGALSQLLKEGGGGPFGRIELDEAKV